MGLSNFLGKDPSPFKSISDEETNRLINDIKRENFSLKNKKVSSVVDADNKTKSPYFKRLAEASRNGNIGSSRQSVLDYYHKNVAPFLANEKQAASSTPVNVNEPGVTQPLDNQSFKNAAPGGNIVSNFAEDNYENYQNGGNVVGNPQQKVEIIKVGQAVQSPGSKKPIPKINKVTIKKDIKNPVQRYATVDPFNLFGNRNGVNPFSLRNAPITNDRFSGGVVPSQ
jgi:hypothetical protein